jgi:very-short-patch-repair endonuclease
MAARVVVGQRVTSEKLERARQLRHTMTGAERILWRYLRGHRLEGWGFRRQQVIAGLIVDFYCHEASLVVEVDGPVHETQRDYDRERDRVLNALGLRVLHFTNDEVMHALPAVLTQIAASATAPTPVKSSSRSTNWQVSPLPVGEGSGVGFHPKEQDQ